MKILAFDFSSPQRSVAVWNGSAIASEIVDVSPGRDMKPLALIERALTDAGLPREAIDCIAVGLGPGSYTGIRVALSLAQGWQLAAGVKLIGMSSAAAIASQAAASGVDASFNVVVDAQRGEFYVARYVAEDGDARETEALRLMTAADVRELKQRGELLVGPEVTRWFPQGRPAFPSAVAIAKWARGQTDFVPGETLEPIYLRQTEFVKAPPPRKVSFTD